VEKVKIKCYQCGKQTKKPSHKVIKEYKTFCDLICYHEYLSEKKTQYGRGDIPGSYTRKDIVRQWHRQNGECFWCGKRCGGQPQDRGFHVDHLTPVSKKDAGATHDPRNLVIACSHCNHLKYDKLPVEFKGYRIRHNAEKTYRTGTDIKPKQLRLPI